MKSYRLVLGLLLSAWASSEYLCATGSNAIVRDGAVKIGFDLQDQTLPTVTNPPHDVAVTSGESATFQVTATGNGTLTYQWRRYGVPIAQATAATYTISPAHLTDTDFYDVVVSNAAGSVTSPMARLDVAPTSYPGQLGIDQTWSVPVTKDGASANQVLPLPGGGFMAAGDFGVVDGHPTGAVARFKPDGSIDPSFTSPLLGQANRLALQPDGRILVLGWIRVMTPEGLRSSFVRLERGGAIDPTFDPPPVSSLAMIAVAANGQIYVVAKRDVSGSELVRLNPDGSRDTSFNAPFPSNAGYQAIAIQSDGNLLVSYYLNGTSPMEYRLARLLATTGAEDPLFTPPTINNVAAILPLASGQILLTGLGLSGGPTISYCTRLNADGTVDGAFARLPIAGVVYSLVAEGSGTILLGGHFDQVDSTARGNIARLNADGSLAPALTGAPETYTLYSVASLADGHIVAAQAIPLSDVPSFFGLGADGVLDPDFAPALRSPGQIAEIVRQDDGLLVIAGNFSHVGDVPQSNLARLKLDGSVDTSFAPGGGPSNEVQVLRRLADGSLFVGGTFGSVGGVIRPSWARLDRNGTPDERFSGSGGVSANGNDKHTVLPLPDGSIIVASDYFTELVSQNFLGFGGIIRLTPTGDYDPNFSSAYGIASQGPFASVLQTDGKLVLGGYGFGSSGTRIIRLLADGHVDYDYHFPNNVFGLAVARDGTLWAASSYGLSRLQPDGSPVPNFASPPGLEFFPLPPPRLFSQNDGRMVVAGLVLNHGMSTSVTSGSHLLRFATNGSIDPTCGLTGLTSDITAIVQRDDGQFYLASDGALHRTKNLAAPSIDLPPIGAVAQLGTPLVLSVTASGEYLSYQWRKNGIAIAGAVGSTLTLGDVEPADAAVYSVAVTSPAGTIVSDSAVVGIASTAKVAGDGEVVGHDIVHRNGNVYDQILLTGPAATFTTDANKVTRLSFIDLDDDIVQVEMSGAGSVTVTLENATGPAAPTKYNQPEIQYMKGHASLVIAGADETTNLSVFSVGKANAVNQALFKESETYDGIADIGLISITSSNGKFGGIRTADANYFRASGLTGINAPGVAVLGPVYVGGITADADATPVLLFGSTNDMWITGGDLLQLNDRAVQVDGITQLKFTAGQDSHGHDLPAQANKAKLEQNGTDITTTIVVGP